MRHFSNVVRLFSLTLLFSVAAVAQQDQPAGQQTPSNSAPVTTPSQLPAPMGVQVIYTGNMFGYFRLPDEQTTGEADRYCPTGTDEEIRGKANAEGQALLKALKVRPENSLVVGMGENFTPELLSRIMTDKGDKRPRDLFTFDYLNDHAWKRDEELNGYEHLLAEIARGKGRIPVDNVACLLSFAGYTAVVPGKHDFYFGPEYLRYLARLLASPTGDQYHPVHMLAANLVIQTTVRDAAKRIPFRDKTGLHYSDDPGNIAFEYSDGDTILPWIRYIKVTITKPENGPFHEPAFSICPAVDDSDPDDADVPGWNIPRHEPCAHLKEADKKTDAAENKEAKEDKKRKIDRKYKLPEDYDGHTFLMPNRNYLLCATRVDRGPKSKEGRPYCQHLSVYSPFFYYPYVIPRVKPRTPETPETRDSLEFLDNFTDDQKPQFRNPRPYTVIKVAKDGTHEETRVAIFGVVDQDINEHIGKLNYAWLNEETNKKDNNLTAHESYSTEVKAMEPVTALRQQLQYFHEVENGDPLKAKFDGIKILLAQMPAYKARLLAAAMKGEFNLIIAQAELEEATPFRTDTTKIPADPLPAPEDPDPTNKECGPNSAPCPPPAPSSVTAKDKEDSKLQRCGPGSTDCTFASPTFVAVPAPFFEIRYRDKLQLQVRSASILMKHSCSPSEPDCAEEWDFDNRLFGSLLGPEFCPDPRKDGSVNRDAFAPCVLRNRTPQQLFAIDNFKQSIRESLSETEYYSDEHQGRDWTKDDAFNKFKQFVLLVMQKRLGTDIAVLQERDFFQPFVPTGTVVNASNIQEMLDRILWKGDFLLKIYVRGDQLKKILERSKQFDEDDKSSLSLAHERLRGLIKLGVFLDRTTSSYIVNGEVLDENKLYTVATSDYLGLGDTGYSDLLTPLVGKPLTPSDFKSVEYISGLVCEEMDIPNSNSDTQLCHSLAIEADRYFAELQQRPFDNTRGFTPLRHLISWAKIQKRRPPLYDSNKVDGTERSFQERPLWSINLSKLALGFTMNQHNHGSEANLANLFGGITTVPVVSAANTNTTTLDSSLRMQFNSGHREFFAQTDAAYTRQLTRQNNPNNTDLATQPKNQFAFETGILPRLYPRTKEIPGLKELISFRLETQLANPLTNFRLGTGDVLAFIADRTQTVLGKYGLRFQNQKSWIESGYQAGELIASPTGFLFNPPITNPLAVTCTASSAKRSFAKCIKDSSGAGGKITATSQVQEFTRNHFEHGLFLNFKMNMPLPGKDKLAYVMENKGQLFFNRGDDFSVETKLYEDWTHSLVVPLFGNFSFVPKVEIIAFQNKVDNSFFWTLQPTLSVQYSFDWHNGVGWKRGFAYQNPQVASKAAQ